jgi:hypothetical protein
LVPPRLGIVIDRSRMLRSSAAVNRLNVSLHFDVVSLGRPSAVKRISAQQDEGMNGSWVHG